MTHRLKNIVMRNWIVSKRVRTVVFSTTKFLSTLTQEKAGQILSGPLESQNILSKPCADRSQENKNPDGLFDFSGKRLSYKPAVDCVEFHVLVM